MTVLFVSGFKALFNYTILPIGKTVAVSALSIVWISMFLGYFSSTVNYLGGTFGYQINEWLALTLGRFGSLILISCVGYVFALILFNVTFAKVLTFFRKDEVEEREKWKIFIGD